MYWRIYKKAERSWVSKSWSYLLFQRCLNVIKGWLREDSSWLLSLPHANDQITSSSCLEASCRSTSLWVKTKLLTVAHKAPTRSAHHLFALTSHHSLPHSPVSSPAEPSEVPQRRQALSHLRAFHWPLFCPKCSSPRYPHGSVTPLPHLCSNVISWKRPSLTTLSKRALPAVYCHSRNLLLFFSHLCD